MTTTTTVPETTDYAADFRDAEQIAQATPCNIDGCDGFMHEANLDPEKWAHSLADEYFDNKIITLGTWTVDGQNYVADIGFEGTGTCTAAELREAADVYEAFPQFLRNAAARLDTLNQVEARATALNVDPFALLLATLTDDEEGTN